MTRVLEWSLENETFGLEGSISDSWTLEQRARLIEDWMDDELGRILWSTIVQFRCPPSGTTLKYNRKSEFTCFHLQKPAVFEHFFENSMKLHILQSIDAIFVEEM